MKREKKHKNNFSRTALSHLPILCRYEGSLVSLQHMTVMRRTHLPQNKLHVTELTILKQFAIVLMEGALRIARELYEKE